MNVPSLDEIKALARAHTPKPVGNHRYYAVLLPLVWRDGALYVLYELRALELGVQPGEVSFPGGGIEAGETPRAAALRETVEELGVPAEAVEIVGELDYLITYSNSTLYCFLGVLDAAALAVAKPNAAEVGEVFLVPLAWLLENDPEVYINRVRPEIAADLPVEKLAPHGAYRWRTGTSSVPVYTWAEPGSGGDKDRGKESGEGKDRDQASSESKDRRKEPSENSAKERVIWGMTAQLTKAFVELLRQVV